MPEHAPKNLTKDMVQVIDMIKKISLRKRIVEPGGKLECFMVLTKVGKVCPEPDNRNVVVIAWKAVQPVMIHLPILITAKIFNILFTNMTVTTYIFMLLQY